MCRSALRDFQPPGTRAGQFGFRLVRTLSFCGDGDCNGGEDCDNCQDDCGCSADAVCFEGECCSPDCQNKECGPDGCGGSCGLCDEGSSCTGTGQCLEDDMVTVAGGNFWMGCNETLDDQCTDSEYPQHLVEVGAFEIDRTEVTIDAYALCVGAGESCSPPGVDLAHCNWNVPAHGDHPVNCVTWEQAQQYCEWRCPDCRLCSEAQWEKAARGGCDDLPETPCSETIPLFPWGNAEPTCELAVMESAAGDGCGEDGTWPAGSKEGGASPYGGLDLAGNVWEWVGDCWHDDYQDAPKTGEPWTEDCSDALRPIRGGSFNNNASLDLRTSVRYGYVPNKYYDYLGFRCCRPVCIPDCIGDGICENGLCIVPCDDGNDVAWDGCTGGQVTEFQVNTYTEGPQEYADVAVLGDGSYIVVWQSDGQDGDGNGVYAQRFDASGAKLDVETLLNSTTAKNQASPAVASLGTNGYVVAWTCATEEYKTEIRAQLFDLDGAKKEGELAINDPDEYTQQSPAVARVANDGFVVAWASWWQDGSDQGIIMNRFDTVGMPASAESLVNTFTVGYQGAPAIGAFPQGRFLVQWTSGITQGQDVGEGQDGNGHGVFAQLYMADGAKEGDEFQVNTYSDGDQWAGDVASLEDGRFLVVWTSNGQDGDGHGIYGQRFLTDGTKDGTEFQIHSNTMAHQAYPAAVGRGSAGYVVAWHWSEWDALDADIYVRTVGAEGVFSGEESRANTYLTARQEHPAVASFADGSYVVVWASCPADGEPAESGQDGDSCGIFAQRFNTDGTRLYH